MAAVDHEQLLSRLEQEVNSVLEHTGRLFAAAAAENGRSVATAHASKLKQTLPKSIDRFHEALDQLEDELQMAKLVMRRDLAVCREQAENHDIMLDDEPSAPVINAQPSQNLEGDGSRDDGGRAGSPEDTVMQDSQPPKALQPESETKPDNGTTEGDEVSEAQSTALMQDLESTEAGKVDPDREANQSQTGLQVNTQAQPAKNNPDGEQQPEDDKPPDTGTFSNANDHESLFGPMSAGLGDAPDFAVDSNENNDFDFDAFGTNMDNNSADNDNISSLLPGLQDYANNQPSGAEIDFDAMFPTDLPNSTEGQEHANIEHRDSTFDDIFDLGEFNAEEFVGENGSQDKQDFNFSFD